MPQPVKNLGKTDIDFVTDAHVQEQLILIEKLMRKLYIRNPNQLVNASEKVTVDERVKALLGDRLLGELPALDFAELNHLQSIDAINLGLDPNWHGDRVFAVMVGLTGMLKVAYQSKTEFFMLDSLDQQDLYNSARNIDVLNWKISHRFDANGQLLLLTDHHSQTLTDTSFDRLFTRMTTIQDMMANIVASRNHRSINAIVQGVATTFLPVGI